MRQPVWKTAPTDRRYFIGGSDARVIMGQDEAALLRLWREKRGELEPRDLSTNLVVQLGVVYRGVEPALVSGQHRPGPHRHRETHPPSDTALDGSNAGRPRGSH
jgi:hypothetical protein